MMNKLLRINPSYLPIVVDENTVRFTAGPITSQQFTLRDSDGDGELETLIEQIDGTNTVQQVISEFKVDDREQIQRAIEGLVDKNVLYVGDEERDDVVGYLSLIDSEPERTADSLSSAEVVVLGDGQVGRMVSEDLHSIGMTVRQCGETFDDAHVYEEATTVNEEELSSTIEDSDFVVGVTASVDHPLLDVVNERAEDTGTPWMAAQVAGTDGIIGPTVVPGETACYRCFSERLYANINHSDPKLYRRKVESERHETLTAFHRIVAGYVVSEVVQYLSKGTSRLVGRAAFYDFMDMSREVNEVLKLPRCPACGSSSETEFGQQQLMTLEQLVDEIQE